MYAYKNTIQNLVKIGWSNEYELIFFYFCIIVKDVIV